MNLRVKDVHSSFTHSNTTSLSLSLASFKYLDKLFFQILTTNHMTLHLNSRVTIRHDFNGNGSLLDYIMIIRKKNCQSNKKSSNKGPFEPPLG